MAEYHKQLGAKHCYTCESGQSMSWPQSSHYHKLGKCLNVGITIGAAFQATSHSENLCNCSEGLPERVVVVLNLQLLVMLFFWGLNGACVVLVAVVLYVFRNDF
eukprot:1317699-Amphidinium_carterae.1